MAVLLVVAFILGMLVFLVLSRDSVPEGDATAIVPGFSSVLLHTVPPSGVL